MSFSYAAAGSAAYGAAYGVGVRGLSKPYALSLTLALTLTLTLALALSLSLTPTPTPTLSLALTGVKAFESRALAFAERYVLVCETDHLLLVLPVERAQPLRLGDVHRVALLVRG